jgi:hypothetical protein
MKALLGRKMKPSPQSFHSVLSARYSNLPLLSNSPLPFNPMHNKLLNKPEEYWATQPSACYALWNTTTKHPNLFLKRVLDACCMLNKMSQVKLLITSNVLASWKEQQHSQKQGCFVVMVKLKLLQVPSRLVWPYDSFHLLFWNFRASFFTSEGTVPYRSSA